MVACRNLILKVVCRNLILMILSSLLLGIHMGVSKWGR